jgi:hypothetical protein
MNDEWWSTEDVAEFLEIEPQQVYESRRRNEYPGNLGQRRGRSLAFLRSQVEDGPQEPKTTSDPVEALLWTAQGIEAKLGRIHDELRTLSAQVSPEVKAAVAVLVEQYRDTLVRLANEGEEE